MAEDTLRLLAEEYIRVPPSLEEHNDVRPVTGPTGHAGGGLTSSDFGLDTLPGMGSDTPLAGKRKLHMLLRDQVKAAWGFMVWGLGFRVDLEQPITYPLTRSTHLHCWEGLPFSFQVQSYPG